MKEKYKLKGEKKHAEKRSRIHRFGIQTVLLVLLPVFLLCIKAAVFAEAAADTDGPEEMPVMTAVGYLFPDGSFDLWEMLPAAVINDNTVLTSSEILVDSAESPAYQRVLSLCREGYLNLSVDLSDFASVSEDIVYRIYVAGEGLQQAVLAGTTGEGICILTSRNTLPFCLPVCEETPGFSDDLYAAAILQTDGGTGYPDASDAVYPQILITEMNASGGFSFSCRGDGCRAGTPILTKEGSLAGIVLRCGEGTGYAAGNGNLLKIFREYGISYEAAEKPAFPDGAAAEKDICDEYGKTEVKTDPAGVGTSENITGKDAAADADMSCGKEESRAENGLYSEEEQRKRENRILGAVLILLALVLTELILAYKREVKKSTEKRTAEPAEENWDGYTGEERSDTSPGRKENVPTGNTVEQQEKHLTGDPTGVRGKCLTRVSAEQQEEHLTGVPTGVQEKRLTRVSAEQQEEHLTRVPAEQQEEHLTGVSTGVQEKRLTGGQAGIREKYQAGTPAQLQEDCPTECLSVYPQAGLLREKTQEKTEIFRSCFIIGKSLRLSDLSVPDNRTVSRKHCMLRNEDGRWYVSDLSSTNGTGLKKKSAEGSGWTFLKPGEECEIENGDGLLVSDERFLFFITEEV